MLPILRDAQRYGNLPHMLQAFVDGGNRADVLPLWGVINLSCQPPADPLESRQVTTRIQAQFVVEKQNHATDGCGNPYP